MIPADLRPAARTVGTGKNDGFSPRNAPDADVRETAEKKAKEEEKKNHWGKAMDIPSELRKIMPDTSPYPSLRRRGEILR